MMVDLSLGAARMERIAIFLRFGVLVVAVLLAGYVAIWIAFNVFREYPLEFRENAVLLTAQLQCQGDNPYALEHRPVYVNAYGIGYYWVCYPFTYLLGCDYAVLRSVSCGFIFATCLLLVWALRIDGVSWIFATVGGLLLFSQLGEGLSIVARPDGFGMFLFFASLVIPHRFKFSWSALLCSAVLSILGFLTKPYFLLGLGLVWLHVFVFESKSKAVVFGALAGLGLIATCLAIDSLYECYFTETIFASQGAASRSWAHLGKIGSAFLTQNLGFILLVAAGLTRSVTSRFVLKRTMAQRQTTSRWICRTGFRLPLVCLRGNLAGTSLVCNVAVIILVLGLHPGNDILYYHQLITPFLVWIAVRMAEVTFRGHWLANSLLFVNLLILGACASPLPRDYSAEWRSLESLVVSKSDVFTAPHLSRLLQRSGRTVYDAGQTEYAFAASKHNFMPVAEEYRQRSQRFLQVVLLKMRNRQFDLIIINPGICPFLPIEELGRYYAPTSVLSAPMTFDSFIRPYPLTCWVPSKQSEEAPDRRKP